MFCNNLSKDKTIVTNDFQANYSTENADCQRITEKLKKLQKKKAYNKYIIEFLYENNEIKNNIFRAETIQKCANHVGLSIINDMCIFTHADFCHDRLCNICAWRRQVKFLAQTNPIIDLLIQQKYKFIFATLTIENCKAEEINKTIDLLLNAFSKLTKQRKIKRAWKGIIRSLEITYNEKLNNFHPHIHCLIAVDENYYNSVDYISQEELQNKWSMLTHKELSIVHIQNTYGEDTKSQLEVLKYSLKPTKAAAALKIFATKLNHRRLISFTGIFAKMRQELKLTPIEDINITNEDIPPTQTKIHSFLYEFDVTGGVYKFYNSIEFKHSNRKEVY